MGRQMDHRLAHGRFESRNVSTWNCSTIRSPWADSCYKWTLPHCFSRIFPIPCGTQVSLVPGRCSWHIQTVSRLRADACSGTQWGSWPPHGSVKVLPWARGSSLLNFHVASCRNPGREETARVWLSLHYAARKWLGCSHPGDQKCFRIHQFRQASGWLYSDSLVLPWESPLSTFKTRATPHPWLHLTLKLFPQHPYGASWPSRSNDLLVISLPLPPRPLPVIRGRLASGGWWEGRNWALPACRLRTPCAGSVQP